MLSVPDSVAGPNCENDWAREGRRIVPLLRRAVPITSYTASADASGKELHAHNAALKTPIDTKTPKPPPAKKGENGPPSLKDILMDKDGVAKVKQPPVACPAKGGKWGLPPLPDDGGEIFRQVLLSFVCKCVLLLSGDVVILPSGMAVRFKEEPLLPADVKEEDKSEESSEAAKSTPKKNRRKRKGQQEVRIYFLNFVQKFIVLNGLC